MLKSNLIASIQFEILRHDWSTFSEDGLIVPGCSTCNSSLEVSTGQYLIGTRIPGLDLRGRLVSANEDVELLSAGRM
jgi:hypothetical protein